MLLSIGGAGLVSYYSYHDQCSSNSGGGDNSTSLAFIERWSASPNSSCDPSVEKSTPLGYVVCCSDHYALTTNDLLS